MIGMFRVFVGMGLLLTIAVFAFAEVSDFSGRWTATATRGNKTGTFVLNLNLDAEHVTGTLHDPSGQILQIQNGKLDGQHLTFDASAQEHGRNKIIHFDAELGGDAITLRNESNGKQGVTMIFHRSASKAAVFHTLRSLGAPTICDQQQAAFQSSRWRSPWSRRAGTPSPSL